MFDLLTYLSPFFILVIFFLCFCRFVFRGCRFCGVDSDADCEAGGEASASPAALSARTAARELRERRRAAASALARVHPCRPAVLLAGFVHPCNDLPKYEDAIKFADPPPAYSPPISARDEVIMPPAYTSRRSSISRTAASSSFPVPLVHVVTPIPEPIPDHPSAVPIAASGTNLLPENQAHTSWRTSLAEPATLTLSVARLASDHQTT